MSDAGMRKSGAEEHVEESAGHNKLIDFQEAQRAFEGEHNVPFRQAIRENWKAAMWSAVVSLTIIMEGYDLSLMGNFISYPAFREKFGRFHEELGDNGDYELSADWQAGLNNGGLAMIIIGGFINGWAASRWGYRKTLQGSLIALCCFIFITFFAQNTPMYLVGHMLNGLAHGVFATTGPAYASEVVPTPLRAYMTTYINLCWALGQFTAAGMLRGMLTTLSGNWGWRVPVSIQWFWPIPIFILLCYAPESPWWLVRHERYDEALRNLKRLSTKSVDDSKASLAQIVHTVQLENEIQKSGTYADCFRGSNLRRTEICMLVFAGQCLCGGPMAYTPTYFFLQAGLDPTEAFNILCASHSLAVSGTIISFFLIPRFGRRRIYIFGMMVSWIAMMLIGIIAAAGGENQGAKWAQVAFALMWKLNYSLTIGPIAYAIISEVSAVFIRPQTIVIGRNTYNICNLVIGFINPRMLNPTMWNIKGKTGFLYMGTALVITAWSWFRLPETRDRTFEELDLLFEHRVKARKFRTAVVNPYAAEGEEKVKLP